MENFTIPVIFPDGSTKDFTVPENYVIAELLDLVCKDSSLDRSEYKFNVFINKNDDVNCKNDKIADLAVNSLKIESLSKNSAKKSSKGKLVRYLFSKMSLNGKKKRSKVERVSIEESDGPMEFVKTPQVPDDQRECLVTTLDDDFGPKRDHLRFCAPKPYKV